MQLCRVAKQSERYPLVIGFIVIFLVSMGQFNNTLYIPSLPAIVKGLESTAHLVKLSLTLNLIAFGFAQFVYGPFSDRFGRRLTGLIGISIFFFGSIICLVSNNINLFLLGRIVQGLGIGCVGAIGRAIARDVFAGKQFLKYVSYLTIGMAVTPVISPIVGGFLQYHFSWRANFILLLILSITMLLTILFCLPETNVNLNKKVSCFSVISNYMTVLQNKRFSGLVLCNMLAFSGEIVFYMVASFLLQDQLGFNAKEFGSIALLIVPCVMSGGFLVSYLSHRYNAKITTLIGIIVLLIGAILMLLFAFAFSLSLYTIIIPMMIYTFGEGIVSPSSSAGSMILFPDKAGIAGSLTGGVAMAGTGLISVTLARFHFINQWPLAILLCAIGLLSLVFFYFMVYRNWEKYSEGQR